MKMKKNILIYLIIIIGLLFIISNSCKKEVNNNTVEAIEISTISICNITDSTAKCGGKIASDGGYSITRRGVCWSSSQNPTIASAQTVDGYGTGAYISNIIGLTANATYYVRAYAINSTGTYYGNQLVLNTSGTVTDIDGNVYRTLPIGSQVWMKENLKVTKYNDGTPIANIINNELWQEDTLGAYAWYDNNQWAYKNVYGGLYNWYAVHTNKLCPVGWHVSMDYEWQLLIDSLGGVAKGGKLKEAGTSHWETTNSSVTNESDFTALPGGQKAPNGSSQFEKIRQLGMWWTTSSAYSDHAWARALTCGPELYRAPEYKSYGKSVRCVRDNNYSN